MKGMCLLVSLFPASEKDEKTVHKPHNLFTCAFLHSVGNWFLFWHVAMSMVNA